jgi:DNA mismatch repair protein MutL
MDSFIRLLPDALANQIAAGEVVQRPASVVKELLENAVDAGADDIVVRIRDGGKTFIQVTDNGRGMGEVDARLCFERHATSKIRAFDDMQALRTYGFRGEALASIAAVSQLELRTRPGNQETGTLIRIEGSEVKGQEVIACPKGSSFTVRNLFFNVPARRNFLKSTQVEFSHISEEVYRVALAYPEVQISFYHGEGLIWKAGPGPLLRRLVSVFGDSFRENLLSVSEETDLVRISGFIGNPGLSRKTRGEQYFFANRRFIRNAYLHHAVAGAFGSLLPAASFPFYVLNLDLPPEKIDINVHPTKTEIKFEDERFVYAILQAAIRKALQQSQWVPALDFEPPSPWMEAAGTRSSGLPENSATAITAGFYQPPAGRPPVTGWEQLFGDKETRPETRIQEFESAGSAPSLPAGTPAPGAGADRFRSLSLHGRFLLVQVKSGLMAVHLERAWERIAYERRLREQESGPVFSQQLLFPVTLSFTQPDLALLREAAEEIRGLGVDWDFFGGADVVVRGLPADLKEATPRDLFYDFLDQLRQHREQIRIPRSQALARALARRGSRCQSFSHWTETEFRDLVNRLFACQVPDRTPDGLLISRLLGLPELDAWFGEEAAPGRI